jgi:hypothetical protein
MELFFPLIILFAFMTTAGFVLGKTVIIPFSNGTKQIDKFKYPTLARAQRILRASNTRKRELETKARIREIESKKYDLTREITDKHEKALLEARDKHLQEIHSWDTAFSEVTREKDEQIRREQEAIRAAQRAKELEIWTANEKTRLARFKAEQEALQRAEDQRLAALLQQRERQIQSLAKHHVSEPFNEDNQHMIVVVHGLYIRKLPTKDSRIVDNLSRNAWVTVNGWISYEEVYGNPIWFRLANGEGWVWSGGLNTQSTADLENLNHLKEPGDSYSGVNASGEVVYQYTAPSDLQSMIDHEIEYLKQEKLALEDKARTRKELTAAHRITPLVITTDRINSPYLSITRMK